MEGAWIFETDRAGGVALSTLVRHSAVEVDVSDPPSLRHHQCLGIEFFHDAIPF